MTTADEALGGKGRGSAKDEVVQFLREFWPPVPVRPKTWSGWRSRPAYSPVARQSDKPKHSGWPANPWGEAQTDRRLCIRRALGVAAAASLRFPFGPKMPSRSNSRLTGWHLRQPRAELTRHDRQRLRILRPTEGLPRA